MICDTHDSKCTSYTCIPYAAYIRQNRNQWIRVGTYHLECKRFTPDLNVRITRYEDSDLEKIREINKQNRFSKRD